MNFFHRSHCPSTFLHWNSPLFLTYRPPLPLIVMSLFSIPFSFPCCHSKPYPTLTFRTVSHIDIQNLSTLTHRVISVLKTVVHIYIQNRRPPWHSVPSVASAFPFFALHPPIFRPRHFLPCHFILFRRVKFITISFVVAVLPFYMALRDFWCESSTLLYPTLFLWGLGMSYAVARPWESSLLRAGNAVTLQPVGLDGTSPTF